MAAAVLLAGACSTSSDGSDAGSAPLPGIDDSTAKVGYLIADIGEVKKTFGFEQADYGDVPTITKGIQAVVDHVNANGGAGGRQLEAEIVPFDGGIGTPEQSQQLCADLTQDRGVFAAVIDGQYHSNVLPCYSGANTLVFDMTMLAHDQTQFEQYAPYLWTPSVPEYSSFFRSHLEVLRDDGFIQAGQRIQLLTADDEVARRAAETIAKPFLNELGVSHIQVDFIDDTNVGTIGATAKSAIQSGKSGNIDRVITVGGARILSIALADFEARDYRPLWSMSSFDNPVFVQDNGESLQAARRPGMVGLAYNPAADLSTDRGPAFPDPANPTQQLCVDILTQAGAAPPTATDGSIARENWRLALMYCDATLLIDAALDNVADASEVSAQDFAEGAAAIGTALPSAVGFGSNWGPNVYSGLSTGRIIRWHDDCECFDYDEGSEVLFGTPVTGDPAAGDPGAGDPGAGDPAAGDPAAGDPAGGDPGAGDPGAGDPAAGDPAAGDPAAGGADGAHETWADLANQ